MTPKEFDKELTRLSKLMAKAAYAGNVKQAKEIDQKSKLLFSQYLSKKETVQ
jgi:hypothetical protein